MGQGMNGKYDAIDCAQDEASKWRVRFKTPDGMYAFVNISKKEGFKIPRSEVAEWADIRVLTNPNEYASVSELINCDTEEGG
jgi:hypothetical protein